jgi:hypothetical protein
MLAFVLGLVLAAVVLIPLLRQREPVDDKPVVRLQLTLPDDVTPVRGQPPAVSPDGSRIALLGVDQPSGKRLIYLRPLNSQSAQTVRGTDRAMYPFWSADGGKMGFFADGRLKTVDLATGTLQDICAVPNPADRESGPTTRSCSRGRRTASASSASGGTAVVATPFDAEERRAIGGGFLKDRRRFVFGANSFGRRRFDCRQTNRWATAAGDCPRVYFTPWLKTAGAVEGHLCSFGSRAVCDRYQR